MQSVKFPCFVWTSPISVPVAIILLYLEMGPPVLAGALIIAVIMTIIVILRPAAETIRLVQYDYCC